MNNFIDKEYIKNNLGIICKNNNKKIFFTGDIVSLLDIHKNNLIMSHSYLSVLNRYNKFVHYFRVKNFYIELAKNKTNKIINP